MPKTIIVAGFGPGISKAVAERFGKEGFTVALVARNELKLAGAVKELAAKGVKAQAFAADMSSPEGAAALVKKVRAALGPISVLHWNAYVTGAGDLLKAPPAELRLVVDVATVSLLAAVQEALPDLRAEKGAVLVTNGGLGIFDDAVDATAVTWGAMGLSVANAAKHKLVRVLHQKLKPEGVFVGEVMVTGTVKGTAWDQGNATLDPANIGTKFWDVFQARKEVSARV